MRPELRDHIIAALDETARAVGVETFEQGVDLVCRFGEKFMPLLEQLRTRERAIAALDKMPDLPADEERMAVAACRMLPQFLGIQLREQVPGVLKELLGIKKGRQRALSNDEQTAMCNFIAMLYREGVGMHNCKKRASLRFHVATRTVDRIWANRGNILSKCVEPTFQDVRNWTKKLFM